VTATLLAGADAPVQVRVPRTRRSDELSRQAGCASPRRWLASRLVCMFALLCIAYGFAAPAAATTVSYTLAAEGTGQWLYTFDLTNTSSTSIQELTVIFNAANVLSVAVGGSQPAAWSDPIALQPDPGLGSTLSADALFDSITTSGNGVATGASLGGFTALVTVTDSARPGADVFEVYGANPNYAQPLATGATVLAGSSGPTPVPEPSALALLLTGVAMVLRRRTSGRTARATVCRPGDHS
jgi:hypothetical protein